MPLPAVPPPRRSGSGAARLVPPLVPSEPLVRLVPSEPLDPSEPLVRLVPSEPLVQLVLSVRLFVPSVLLVRSFFRLP
ncbi:hypothetical protein [Streptomyces subrutilus]|uniref:hypothetical protein n=1 Tax=Streptomyces subrutilus TaxID=36818 RepID=UPI002E0D4741|nr:hypothetical protein OG479_00500 [Streptomyces subrutilus]